MSLSSPFRDYIKQKFETCLANCKHKSFDNYADMMSRIEASVSESDYGIRVNKVDITSYLLNDATETTQHQYKHLLKNRYGKLKSCSERSLTRLAKNVAYYALPFFSFGNLSLSMFCDDNRAEMLLFEQSMNAQSTSFLVRDVILTPDEFGKKLLNHPVQLVPFTKNNCYFSTMCLLLQTNKDLLLSVYKESHRLDKEYYKKKQRDSDDLRHKNYVEKLLIFLSKLLDNTKNHDLMNWGQLLRGAFGPFLTNDTLKTQMRSKSNKSFKHGYLNELEERIFVSQEKQADAGPMLQDYLRALFRVKLPFNNDDPKSIVCRYALKVDSFDIKEGHLCATSKGNEFFLSKVNGSPFVSTNELYGYLQDEASEGVKKVCLNGKTLDVSLSPNYMACALEELSRPVFDQTQLKKNLIELESLMAQVLESGNKSSKSSDQSQERKINASDSIKEILTQYGFREGDTLEKYVNVLKIAIKDLKSKQEYEEYVRFSSPLFFEHTIHYESKINTTRYVSGDLAICEEVKQSRRYHNQFMLPSGNGENQSVQNLLNGKIHDFYLSESLGDQDESIAVLTEHSYSIPKHVTFDMQVFDMQVEDGKKTILSIFDETNFSINGETPGTSIIRIKVHDDFKYYKLRAISAKTGNAYSGHWTFFKLPTAPHKKLKFFNNSSSQFIQGLEIDQLTERLAKNFDSGLTLSYEQIEPPSDEIIRELEEIDKKVNSKTPTPDELKEQLKTHRKKLIKMRKLPKPLQLFRNQMSEDEFTVCSRLFHDKKTEYIKTLKEYQELSEAYSLMQRLKRTQYAYVINQDHLNQFEAGFLSPLNLQIVTNVLTVIEFLNPDENDENIDLSKALNSISRLTRDLKEVNVDLSNCQDLYKVIFTFVDKIKPCDDRNADLDGVLKKTPSDERFEYFLGGASSDNSSEVSLTQKEPTDVNGEIELYVSELLANLVSNLQRE
jgi:hypothetical protein